ncbi:unnamed protein product [Rotaria socialis]|uniref:Uncharacterized protein n=1 Tax=Rotaria socialis TaxID=392032 RepID=A0A820VDS1_9BILA|nr:unnamed protein product [Rotaria socialis]CAF4633192.1 unnamed protein product [Rotaria socialis]
MTQKEANFAESTQLTRNDQEKIGTLNLLISTSTQPSNSLFNYYQERAEILFYLNKYEDALSDINAMEKINEIPSSIKLIKWKSLIQIQCAKVSQEIKQSLAIQGGSFCRLEGHRKRPETAIKRHKTALIFTLFRRNSSARFTGRFFARKWPSLLTVYSSFSELTENGAVFQRFIPFLWPFTHRSLGPGYTTNN